MIWSPQSTVAPASLLRFDFRQGRIEGGEAGELAEPRRPSCRGRRFDSSALVVDATVGGHSMQLELDSGSNDTSLLQGSAAGAALWTQSLGGQTTSHGAAGGFASRELGLVPVEVEGYAMLTSVSVIGTDAGADAPAPECPSDGVIGLPVLERCRLALTQTHFSLACE